MHRGDVGVDAHQKVVKLAFRFVPHDQWLTTHVSDAWKVKQVKSYVLHRCLSHLDTSEEYEPPPPDPRRDQHPPSPITFAPHPLFSSEPPLSPIEFAASPHTTRANRDADPSDETGYEEDDEWDDEDIEAELMSIRTRPTKLKVESSAPRTSYIPHKFGIIRFSTGQVLEDEVMLSVYDVADFELFEIHRKGLFVSLDRAFLDAYVRPYWEGPVKALKVDDRKAHWSTRCIVIREGYLYVCKHQKDAEPTHKFRMSDLISLCTPDHLDFRDIISQLPQPADAPVGYYTPEETGFWASGHSPEQPRIVCAKFPPIPPTRPKKKKGGRFRSGTVGEPARRLRFPERRKKKRGVGRKNDVETAYTMRDLYRDKEREVTASALQKPDVRSNLEKDSSSTLSSPVFAHDEDLDVSDDEWELGDSNWRKGRTYYGGERSRDFLTPHQAGGKKHPSNVPISHSAPKESSGVFGNNFFDIAGDSDGTSQNHGMYDEGDMSKSDMSSKSALDNDEPGEWLIIDLGDDDAYTSFLRVLHRQDALSMACDEDTSALRDVSIRSKARSNDSARMVQTPARTSFHSTFLPWISSSAHDPGFQTLLDEAKEQARWPQTAKWGLYERRLLYLSASLFRDEVLFPALDEPEAPLSPTSPSARHAYSMPLEWSLSQPPSHFYPEWRTWIARRARVSGTRVTCDSGYMSPHPGSITFSSDAMQYATYATSTRPADLVVDTNVESGRSHSGGDESPATPSSTYIETPPSAMLSFADSSPAGPSVPSSAMPCTKLSPIEPSPTTPRNTRDYHDASALSASNMSNVPSTTSIATMLTTDTATTTPLTPTTLHADESSESENEWQNWMGDLLRQSLSRRRNTVRKRREQVSREGLLTRYPQAGRTELSPSISSLSLSQKPTLTAIASSSTLFTVKQYESLNSLYAISSSPLPSLHGHQYSDPQTTQVALASEGSESRLRRESLSATYGHASARHLRLLSDFVYGPSLGASTHPDVTSDAWWVTRDTHAAPDSYNPSRRPSLPNVLSLSSAKSKVGGPMVPMTKAAPGSPSKERTAIRSPDINSVSAFTKTITSSASAPLLGSGSSNAGSSGRGANVLKKKWSLPEQAEKDCKGKGKEVYRPNTEDKTEIGSNMEATMSWKGKEREGSGLTGGHKPQLSLSIGNEDARWLNASADTRGDQGLGSVETLSAKSGKEPTMRRMRSGSSILPSKPFLTRDKEKARKRADGKARPP